MKKIILLALLFSSASAFAQKETVDLSALQDADYTNFASKHWGPRPEGWVATEELRKLVANASSEAIDCSKKLKYVPKPTLAPPGASYFVGYVISLRGKNKKIAEYEVYEACINKIVADRKTDAYLSQSY